jgi:HipA-like protein
MNGSSSKREMYLPDKDEAAVFKGDRRAGTLTRERRGSQFEYDPEYAGDETAASICFNMPVTTEPYRTEGVNLPPYFANLLPEGELLGRLSRKLKTSRDDLLSFFGGVRSEYGGRRLAALVGRSGGGGRAGCHRPFQSAVRRGIRGALRV